MSMTGQPQTDRPDPSVIAAQNDAFRKLACLGVPTAQSIQGRMHVTRSLMEAGDGFLAEAVKATGAGTSTTSSSSESPRSIVSGAGFGGATTTHLAI